MSNTNTLPPLYALTPIGQTEGLEEGYYHTTGSEMSSYYHTIPPIPMRASINGGWDVPKLTHYLRPLPEGTRVLQPGEVAVSEEELNQLRQIKKDYEQLLNDYSELEQLAMVLKYESGNS